MVDPNLSNSQTEDTFMQAVTRLENGEAFESILADYQAQEQEELRELLSIVAATHHLHESPIPQPAPTRRASHKRAFLQAAAELKSASDEKVSDILEHATIHSASAAETPPEASIPMSAATQAQDVSPTVAVSTQFSGSSPTAKPITRASVAAGPTLGERIQAALSEFFSNLAPMTVRLAPLTIMLVAIWLASFGAVSAAQGTEPGKFGYEAKKWILYQELTLTAPEDRAPIYEEIEQTLGKDTRAAIERGEIVQEEADLLFHGFEGDYYVIGKFYAQANYQPDPNSDETVPTEFPSGQPGEGQQVRIVYRTVPSSITLDTVDGDEEAPVIVQAVLIDIIEKPVIVPTATSTAMPSPTATNTPLPTNTTAVCVPVQPAGWVAYTVRPGESLSVIAQRVGSSSQYLANINCITNINIVYAGMSLYVPYVPANTPIPPANTPVDPAPLTTPNSELSLTLTATSKTATTVPILTPTLSTPTGVATMEGVTPTLVISSTAEIEPNTTPTVIETISITGTVVPIDEATSEATTVPVETTPTPGTIITSTMTSVPAITPDGTAVAPSITPTPPPTAGATAEADETATAPPIETTRTIADGTPVVTAVATTPGAPPDGTNTAATTPDVPSTVAATPSATIDGESNEDGESNDNDDTSVDDTSVDGASGENTSDDGTTDGATVNGDATATPIPPATMAATVAVSPPTVSPASSPTTVPVATTSPTATSAPLPSPQPVPTTVDGEGEELDRASGGDNRNSAATPPSTLLPTLPPPTATFTPASGSPLNSP